MFVLQHLLFFRRGEPSFPAVGSASQQSAFHPSSQSPISSAAAPSEVGAGLDSTRKKKKERKGRRQDNAEEFSQEFAFPSSGFGQASEAVDLGSSAGFAGWPASSSGAVDIGGASSSRGISANPWDTDGANNGAAPAWPTVPEASLDAGFEASWGAASSYTAPPPELPIDRKSGGSSSRPIAVSRGHSFDAPAASFGTFEEPLPGKQPDVGLASHTFDAGLGSHGAKGVARGFDAIGLGSQGSHVSRGYGSDVGVQKATLHIRRPFAEVEFDRDGFGMMFAQVAAQAVGVPTHRIRVPRSDL